ncbi:MAG TPA: hypothetical protein VIX15_17265, partial [Streptosporangiaceae bacterium]
PGCPFLPRCSYGTDACTRIDMELLPVATSQDPEHVTACPFVLPGTPPREVRPAAEPDDLEVPDHLRLAAELRTAGEPGS